MLVKRDLLFLQKMNVILLRDLVWSHYLPFWLYPINNKIWTVYKKHIMMLHAEDLT
jgi:hypothetical protein